MERSRSGLAVRGGDEGVDEVGGGVREGAEVVALDVGDENDDEVLGGAGEDGDGLLAR